MTLADIMTFKEASQKWGLGDSTLRSLARSGRLVKGVDFRKSGNIWLIKKDAMLKLYGLPTNLN